MKVITPTNTTHSVTLIPRFETSEPLTLLLYNENTKVETTVSNMHSITNGELTITYDFTFVDKDMYQIKILDSGGVVYRGKILATSQVTQDFKLTDGLYFYE